MKKSLVRLSIALGAIALVFSFAPAALAALTLGALTIASDGALTIDGAAGSAITIGDAAQTGTISVGASTGAMTLNLGTGNGAKTVAVATGTGIDTINIGTGGTAADDINIGDALADVDITGASAFVAGTGDPLTITANAASTWSSSAGDLTIDAAAASLVLDSGEATADAVRIIASDAAGGIDIDSGTGDISIVSTDDITINGGSAGSILNLGTNTQGNVINIGTDNTTLDAINIGSALDTVIIRGTSAALSQVELAATRPTGATGSYQTLAGDLNYVGAAGGTSTYHAGVMGNFLGDTLTNTNATIHAGTIGKYSVTTSDGLVGPKAGLVGEAETSVANSAVMAVLGGDTGTVTPGAAYGVRYLNSTAASKFTFGLDLFSAAVGSYKAVDYGTADIRLQNGETISNGTDGRIILTGGQLDISGTVPTVAVTGGAGSASIIANSTDTAGQVSATSDASNTAIVLTFASTYTVAPICVISGVDAGGANAIGSATGVKVTSTATTMTLTYAGIAEAKTFNYYCIKST